MLVFVVFVSGAVLMALEMVGSRILAPYFGNSIYVWGSLISVVLASLTAGYFGGGRLADVRPRFEWLGWIIVVPGVFVTLLPLWAGSFNTWMLATGTDVRTGSLLASLALFFLPGIFLGAVSPYALRLAAKAVNTIGNTAGMLYAVSTAGSIVGTLFTAFYLISWLGVRHILYVLGLVLLLLGFGVVLWAAARRPHAFAGRPSGPRRGVGGPAPRGIPRSRPWLGLVAVIALAGAGVALGQGGGQWTGLAQSRGSVLYERDSAYHHILVVDEATGMRYLKFDDSWQSGMDRADPKRLIFNYTRYFHLAMALASPNGKALFVGLGGGSTPKSFLSTYPHLSMDVAELDPAVVDVAHRYFEVPSDDPRLRISAEDGRLFVRRTEARYDAIFLDAYFAHSIPFHLATVEFMRELDRHLQPGGVVASNIIGSLSGVHSLLFRSMLKSMKAVFPAVYVFPVGATSGSATDPLQRNIIVLATRAPALAPEALYRQVDAAEAEGRVPAGTGTLARSLVVEEIPLDDVPALTDDFAPVDTLIRI